MRSKGFKWLPGFFMYSMSVTAHAADLTVRIDQSFVDHVTTDMTYPYAIVDASPPCDPASFNKLAKGAGGILASDVVAAASQKENKGTEWARQVNDWAKAWSEEIKAIETNKAAISENKKPWEGLSDAEIADAKDFKLPVAACMTHERVTLDQKPSIKVNPPGVLVGIPSISAHAHVQVFVWNPVHHCTKQACFLHVCLCYAWEGGWDPLGGGFDLGTDHATANGKLSARAAGAEVFLDPTIDRLRFASPWDWIPLERFVNGAIQPLKILDVRTINIPLDVLGLAYIGKSVTVSSNPGYLEASGVFEKH